MDRNKDILGLISRLIYEGTLYLRHWPGKVIDDQDPSKRGRVKVTVPELGFMKDSEAMWASPRQGYSLIPPKKDEWVEVYFMGGDARRPVYLIGLGEITGNAPVGYTDPKSPILWQDRKTSDSVKYDQSSKKLTVAVTGDIAIDGATVNVDQGTNGAARMNDAIGIDLLTDPVNVPMIIAVCAIFGMAVVPPIVGKVTGGSTKVKIG
jgi:phage baseplate assembly protein gpV